MTTSVRQGPKVQSGRPPQGGWGPTLKRSLDPDNFPNPPPPHFTTSRGPTASHRGKVGAGLAPLPHKSRRRIQPIIPPPNGIIPKKALSWTRGGEVSVGLVVGNLEARKKHRMTCEGFLSDSQTTPQISLFSPLFSLFFAYFRYFGLYSFFRFFAYFRVFSFSLIFVFFPLFRLFSVFPAFAKSTPERPIQLDE